MKNDSIWKEIELYNADGVDFVSMSFYANLAKNGNPLPFQIYKSYSKEEWETCMSIPKTHYRDYYAEAVRNLMKQVSDIQDVKFKCCDYKEIKVSDFVIYCDPPYANTTKFANSTKFNHSEFWNIMSKWSTNNIVLVSELIAPEDWVCIWEKKNIQRSLGDNNKQRAVEKLFIHKTNLTN